MSDVTVAGVDVGGTHTRVGLVSTAGEILHRKSIKTESERGSEFALGRIGDLVERALAASGGVLAGVGIAVTGPVDHRTGIVDNPHTLHGWGPTDLVSPLETRFGVPVYVENDANAAALGELWCGAGRGIGRLAAVTIGTGIGVGLVVDGQVQRDGSGRHGEAGHHVLDPHGPRCYCGAHGCWEVLAAGPALVRHGRHWLVTNGAASEASTPGRVAEAVIAAALAGEPSATAILDEIAGWIGLGLVNLIAFFGPQEVIVGGGLGARCFSLISPVATAILERHRAMVPTDVAVVPAETGDDAGILGAAFAALQRVR